ncbi:MAG: crossover junction endodeoxyribonuclease RuvC [Thermomicrobiales bacterium]
MITLGIDPGTALLGYGVVASDGDPSLIEFGVVETRPDLPMPERLVSLYDYVAELLDRHRPDAVSIEQLFFARNVTTAIAVGQARGVVLLAAAKAGVGVVEYSPSEIKHAVVGYGRADKAQIQEMVRIILGLAEAPRPDDAADALAVAICHVHRSAFEAKTSGAASDWS